MKPVLEVEHITKYYGRKGNVTKAINDISFQVQEGEFIGIMGASGSGKTTLLNCISTIDSVTGGQIIVDGKDITKMKKAELAAYRREKLGFIFQNFSLLDTLTAYENIALALTIMKCRPQEIEERVKNIAEALDITEILPKYPYEMSGGQQQRVAAARAMIGDPRLVLADEPTGALDSKSAKMLLSILEDLNARLNATILMVTHDAVTASYCKKILFIKDGKLYDELNRGSSSRADFFNQIIQIVSALGGDELDLF